MILLVLCMMPAALATPNSLKSMEESISFTPAPPLWEHLLAKPLQEISVVSFFVLVYLYLASKLQPLSH